MKSLWLVTLGILLFFGSEALGALNKVVIIGLKRPGGLSAQSVIEALQKEIEGTGGHIELERPYTLIDAVVARVDPATLKQLAQNPHVRYLVPDGLVATPERWAEDSFFFFQPQSVELYGTPVEFYSWGVKRVRAPAVHRASPSELPSWGGLLALGMLGAWALGVRNSRRLFVALVLGSFGLLSGGCTLSVVLPHPGILGEGVEVALLDTGIDLRHPDLRENVLGGIDLFNGDDNPQDDNGHGTGVAGLLAAAENGVGLIGVAPRVKLWAIKMLGRDEQGSISDLIRGIEWAVERGAKILNMSLGTPDDNPALREAIGAAYRAGVLLVAAAGNKGDRVLFPAAYPEVIAVGATNRNDQRAWFSNMGPEVELAAPGTDLLSAALQGGYRTFNGTSFAVPHVSGVAALLFAAGLQDAQRVRQRLDQTAEDLGLLITAQGYGLVDAERAVLGRE